MTGNMCDRSCAQWLAVFAVQLRSKLFKIFEAVLGLQLAAIL